MTSEQIERIIALGERLVTALEKHVGIEDWPVVQPPRNEDAGDSLMESLGRIAENLRDSGALPAKRDPDDDGSGT